MCSPDFNLACSYPNARIVLALYVCFLKYWTSWKLYLTNLLFNLSTSLVMSKLFCLPNLQRRYICHWVGLCAKVKNFNYRARQAVNEGSWYLFFLFSKKSYTSALFFPALPPCEWMVQMFTPSPCSPHIKARIRRGQCNKHCPCTYITK